MRLGFRSPDDLAAVLVDREHDGAVSRSAAERARRATGHPAKTVRQPHVAADDEQVSFDVRRIARALDDETRRREIVHVVLFPDQLAGEAIQLGQEAGHVIEVEKAAVDRRSGRDAALGSICRSGVGYCLVNPLDREPTNGVVVDRSAVETPRVEINSLRESRSLYRQQQQCEAVPTPETEHECLPRVMSKNAPVQRGGMLAPRSDGPQAKASERI